MADVNDGRKCGECRYLKRMIGEVIHECRRNSPWPMLVPKAKTALGPGGMEHKTEIRVQAFYPPMRETSDMCGEFEEIRTAPPSETKQ